MTGELKLCSCRISLVCSRHTMSYVRYLLEGEVTLTESWAMPDGLRLRTFGPSNLLRHRQLKTYLVVGPAHVLQKLDTQVLVTEQGREETQVHRAVNPYRTRHVWRLHYSSLIFWDNLLHIFYHFSLHTVLHYTNWRCKRLFTELSAYHEQRYSYLAVEKTQAEVTKEGGRMHCGNETSNGG